MKRIHPALVKLYWFMAAAVVLAVLGFTAGAAFAYLTL